MAQYQTLITLLLLYFISQISQISLSVCSIFQLFIYGIRAWKLRLSGAMWCILLWRWCWWRLIGLIKPILNGIMAIFAAQLTSRPIATLAAASVASKTLKTTILIWITTVFTLIATIRSKFTRTNT